MLFEGRRREVIAVVPHLLSFIRVSERILRFSVNFFRQFTVGTAFFEPEGTLLHTQMNTCYSQFKSRPTAPSTHAHQAFPSAANLKKDPPICTNGPTGPIE